MTQRLRRSPSRRDASGRWSGCWSGGVFAAALVAMVVLYAQLWADPFHRTLGSANHTNDPMQMMWNLRWVPWAILHGHDPLHTTAIYYPHGVALSWNTVAPTLGVLAAPLTLSAGPVFTFAVLMTVGPALTSLTAFWWLRRHTRRPLPAAVGGLVVGFSPFMSGHMLGHLNLTFTCLVPLMLMLIEDLLWRAPRPARRSALYLGLVTAAQAGISEELILITLIAVMLAIGFAALLWRGVVAAALRAAIPGLARAAVIFLLVSSPLLVDQLLLSPAVNLHAAYWRADLDDYLYPLSRQWVNPHHPYVTYLGGAEDGVFLGPALIAVLAVGVAITIRRDRAVRVACAVLAVLVVFTFGNSGRDGLPLPWRLFSDLPALRSVLPARFAFESAFVIAWLLSRWIDQLTAPGRSAVSLGAKALGMLGIAGALVTIMPAPVGASSTPAAAAFFGSAQERRLLPQGAPVLLLPAPNYDDASGMYYQQQADFRFSQPGGYALRPGHRGAQYGPPSSPLIVLAAAAGAVRPPAYSASEVRAAQRQLRGQHYRAVLVLTTAASARHFAQLAERLTGHGPSLVTGGVAIWLLAAPG